LSLALEAYGRILYSSIQPRVICLALELDSLGSELLKLPYWLLLHQRTQLCISVILLLSDIRLRMIQSSFLMLTIKLLLGVATQLLPAKFLRFLLTVAKLII
jgi:hypothetical protein